MVTVQEGDDTQTNINPGKAWDMLLERKPGGVQRQQAIQSWRDNSDHFLEEVTLEVRFFLSGSWLSVSEQQGEKRQGGPQGFCRQPT